MNCHIFCLHLICTLGTVALVYNMTVVVSGYSFVLVTYNVPTANTRTTSFGQGERWGIPLLSCSGHVHVYTEQVSSEQNINCSITMENEKWSSDSAQYDIQTNMYSRCDTTSTMPDAVSVCGWGLEYSMEISNVYLPACNDATDVVTTRVFKSIWKLPSPVNATDQIRSEPLKGLDRPAVKMYVPANWTELSGKTTW